MSENQAQADLINDLTEVCPALADWAIDRIEEGQTAEQVKDKLGEAVRYINSER